MRDISWGQANSRAKRIARMQTPTENGREMIKRALGELNSKGPIMVLNDEVHHCHNTQSQLIELQGEDKKIADLWFNGIREIANAGRLHSAVDLSATPLAGVRYGKDHWTVMDLEPHSSTENSTITHSATLRERNSGKKLNAGIYIAPENTATFPQHIRQAVREIPNMVPKRDTLLVLQRRFAKRGPEHLFMAISPHS